MPTVSEKYEVEYEQYKRPAPEPTLGALPAHLVRTTVPRRLYQILHLALPVAIDFAMRPAAWNARDAAATAGTT